MVKSILRLATTLGVVMGLVSCQMQNGFQPTQETVYSPFPTSTPPLVAFETATPSFTFTPEVATETSTIEKPVATPIPIPTPVFPASLVADGLLLSTGASPTCELPCWHDLRIGISTQADVQRVFTELLDAEEGFDFFFYPVYSLTNDIEGVIAGGHNWDIEESESGPLGTYYLHAFMDEETGLLLGFREKSDPYTMYEVPTLPEVVERLGKPDWLYGGPTANGAGFIVVLIYEQGIRINLFIPYNNFIDSNTAIFCYDDQPHNGTYTLVEPYVSLDKEDWSPLKKTMQIPQDPAPYIDEGFGMSSIDEFVEFVTSDNPCIEVPR